MGPHNMASLTVIRETADALQQSLEPTDDPTLFTDFQFLYTNRGNKLKRGASEVELGHLAGSRPYKKKIVHAGYTRNIIHANPLRYDSEGYQILSSGDNSDAEYDVGERDPYHGVDVLGQLMPLTRPDNLQRHPAMALPYKSKVLDDMVASTCTMLHNERRKLAELKTAMTTLRGDYNWVPCGKVDSEPRHNLTNGLTNGVTNQNLSEEDIFKVEILPEDVDRIRVVNGNIVLAKEQRSSEEQDVVLPVKADPDLEATVSSKRPFATSAWPLPDPPSSPSVPAAEESKRLLTAVVQKQTEIVQGVSQLYNNLLRAKRMKETVWRWCRAEAHVDEMSDGEDWVDLEEWGLSQMLTKGTQEGLGIGNGGDDPEYLARRAEAGGGGGRGRRRGAQ